MNKYLFQYNFSLDIPFFDVDSMDVVWHGHYVKYFEMARCAFLSAIHYDYNVMKKQGYAWPVVQLQIKYVRPAKFGQKIEVQVFLKEYESCLKLDYIIIDAYTREKLTKGSTMQVAVEIETLTTQFQTPKCWISAIEKAIHRFKTIHTSPIEE